MREVQKIQIEWLEAAKESFCHEKNPKVLRLVNLAIALLSREDVGLRGWKCTVTKRSEEIYSPGLCAELMLRLANEEMCAATFHVLKGDASADDVITKAIENINDRSEANKAAKVASYAIEHSYYHGAK